MTNKRRTYRVNADSVDTLVDILVGTPDEFNLDRDKLRGRTIDSRRQGVSPGRLNGADYDTLRANWVQERISYVIYSYQTPIAWRIYDRAFPSPNNEQHWVMPQHPPMTNTSAKHVNKVRAALTQITRNGFDNV